MDFKQLRNEQPDALVPKPRIAGFDVSGIVVSAGEGTGFEVGDAVYGMLPLVGALGRPLGALTGELDKDMMIWSARKSFCTS